MIDLVAIKKMLGELPKHMNFPTAAGESLPSISTVVAKFYAAAPQTIAALVDEVERLENGIADIRDDINRRDGRDDALETIDSLLTEADHEG